MSKSEELKNRVKKAFLRGFKSKYIQHPLFDASRTEAKRLLVTRKGLQELKRYDGNLHRLLSKWVERDKLTSREVVKKIDKWIVELKRKTGDTKKSYRTPTRVFHHKSKSGVINRPLDLIHMDLADVNRLNPDKQTYRYPFILVAVDAFTNYVVLIPIKNKSADEVLNAMKNVFSQFGLLKNNLKKEKSKSRSFGKCLLTTNIQTDRGSEFFNRKVKQFLKDKQFTLFSTRGAGKAYLAESKIGQMKRQLVRITKILESSSANHAKRKRRKTDSLTKRKKRKSTNKKIVVVDDDDEDFVDFKAYATDWSKHLRELQKKINNKVNSRTGLSPTQLFDQFKINHCEKNRNVNETEEKFEPISDTLTKMMLLRKSNSKRKMDKKKLHSTMRSSKAQNKYHEWKRIKVGDVVYLTFSRLKGFPSEKPLNIFEKKSTQLQSEWDTNRPYVVVKQIIPEGNSRSEAKQYQLKNLNTNKIRRTLYYREELLLKK